MHGKGLTDTGDVSLLEKKIINTSISLRKWNRKFFGLYKDRIFNLEHQIKCLQSLEPTDD